MEIVGFSDALELGAMGVISEVGSLDIGSGSPRTELFEEEGSIGSLSPRARPVDDVVGVGGKGCLSLYSS